MKTTPSAPALKGLLVLAAILFLACHAIVSFTDGFALLPSWAWTLAIEVSQTLVALGVCAVSAAAAPGRGWLRGSYFGTSLLVLLLAPVVAAFPASASPSSSFAPLMVGLSFGLFGLVLLVTVAQVLLGLHLMRRAAGPMRRFGVALAVLPLLANCCLLAANLDIDSAPWLAHFNYGYLLLTALLPLLLAAAVGTEVRTSGWRRMWLLLLVFAHSAGFLSFGVTRAFPDEALFEEDPLPAETQPKEVSGEFGVETDSGSTNVSEEQNADDVEWEDI